MKKSTKLNMMKSNCEADVAISSNMSHPHQKGGITRPKKKVSCIEMVGNLKYLEGGYIVVCVIGSKEFFTQS
jgi:hypothetical protein